MRRAPHLQGGKGASTALQDQTLGLRTKSAERNLLQMHVAPWAAYQAPTQHPTAMLRYGQAASFTRPVWRAVQPQQATMVGRSARGPTQSHTIWQDNGCMEDACTTPRAPTLF